MDCDIDPEEGVLVQQNQESTAMIDTRAFTIGERNAELSYFSSEQSSNDHPCDRKSFSHPDWTVVGPFQL